jgi:sensor c-di-GMP phosphodiesterase-like protein
MYIGFGVLLGLLVVFFIVECREILRREREQREELDRAIERHRGKSAD